MGRMTKKAAALVAVAAALPAQALEQGSLRSNVLRAATCYGGVSAAAPGDERPPQLIPGLGTATGLQPDTADPEAQKWFEQGLRLLWAYDEAEAIRAFREAQRRDPACALCHWGEAIARSPTLNLQPPNVDVGAAAAAAASAAAAARRSTRLTPYQRALIAAQAIRAPAGADAFDDEGYVQATAALAETILSDEKAGKAVRDADPLLVLAADAQIVRWAATRVPLQRAQTYLEHVLRRNPTHTGAIHFYIHTASDIVEQPAIAAPYADHLGRDAPGATHLIHMASHTFYSTGRFADAVKANRNAMAAYETFESYGPAVSGYRRYLFAHDHHYAIQSALIRGDAGEALDLAGLFARRFPPQDPLFRIRPAHFAAPWFAIGRLRPAEEVIAMQRPVLGFSDAARALNEAAWHYARGEAFAALGRPDDVAGEAAGIAALLAGPAGRALDPESEAIATIARHVLDGRAAMLRGRPGEAAAAYRSAMNAQNYAGFGFDPPPFWYGVRRSLAAAMLAGGDADGAARQLGALAAIWPDDPLATLLSSRIAKARGDEAEARRLLDRASTQWAGGSAVAAMPNARI
jgi:tetratricopeptide (TPR) repeat protein